ncbi:MAG: hypothetical protein KDA45_16830, partial [Planctomycetales bacterium]|nr:hypothetical protein [Planctomycetales bacterium]
VQFTRNPHGIDNALKRIGGYSSGSRLKAANAAEASHMYFAQGVWEGFSGLWATHPPLPKRIRAIDPQWDGSFLGREPRTADALAAENLDVGNLASGFAATPAAAPQRDGFWAPQDEVPVTVVGQAVDHVGEFSETHRHYAAELLKGLPPLILANARESYGARAVVYALLVQRQPEIRQRQMETLRGQTTADIVQLVLKLQDAIDGLDVRSRLPLIDLALPALRAMSAEQYREFRQCFVKLAQADQQIDLFEWMLSQVLLRHLRPQFERVRTPRIHYYGLQQLGRECGELLSMVAAAGNSPEVAQASFRRGAGQLPELKLHQHSRTPKSLDDLRQILGKLARVAPKHRARIVDACAETICHDQHVTWQEAELLRGISDLLDCPMPPLLVTKPVAAQVKR